MLQGLPPLELPDIYNSVVFPTRPSYKVTTADGGEQEFPHDETTLTTDEDRAAWEEYKSGLEKAEAELTEKILNEILIEGIDMSSDHPDVERWRNKQILKGMEIPENEDAMLLLFKRSLVACSTEDINEITGIVMELTGVDKERLDAAKRSFQDSMESES
jgi:hypothetical protein